MSEFVGTVATSTYESKYIACDNSDMPEVRWW